MTSKSMRTLLASAVLTALAAFGSVQAADIIPVPTDPANTGYFDPTPVAPVGGNPGTTRGEQRRIVAQYAASLWGSVLKSDVPIFIQARFLPLATNVLGSAGSLSAFNNFPGAPLASTWYGGALADARAGEDLDPGYYDIRSQFSTNFTFYYGLDGNTPAGLTNFLDVVMHEYAHGLGFASFASAASGTLFNGLQDAYNVYAYNNTSGKFWPQMTNAERQAAAIDTGNVVFTGPRAVAGAQMLLNKRMYFRASAPAPVAGDYNYGTASFGAEAGPANFGGVAVLGTDSVGTPGDGCEPITSNVAGKIAIIDRGICGFAVKAKNAQLAGAIGVIIANNAAGPAPGLGGADPTVVIPTVSVSLADATLFKANLPVSIGFVQDAVLLQGADDFGRPRLFAPNPVQTGSSFSHYDSVALPNLLMEPAINGSLRSYYNLDITPALMADIGWELNTGNSMMRSPNILDCDTGVPAVNDAGLIAGGTVQASHEMCLIAAKTRSQYSSCMTTQKDRLVSSGLLTAQEGQKVMTCARRVTDRTRFPIPQ